MRNAPISKAKAKAAAILSAGLLIAGIIAGLGSVPSQARAQEKNAEANASPKSKSQPQSQSGSISWSAEGRRGAVAAGGAGAAAAGLRLLEDGGNAADAAAATILALSVTDSTGFCFGGEVPILIRSAKTKSVEVISGMGGAPALATREAFEKIGGIPAKGLTPAAVPSALDAVTTLLIRHGTKSFAEAARPTLDLLDAGKADWHPHLASTIRILAKAEADAQSSGADRAASLRAVSDAFYRGPIAKRIGEWSEKNGGFLRAEDFAKHKTRIEAPVTAEYRGLTICKCGPWTQGPALLEALQLLEGHDLKKIGPNDPLAAHLQIEAIKLAFADRDVFYADPEFADVPLQRLISPEYAAIRRPLLDPAKASMEQRPGDPRGLKPLLDESAKRAGLGLDHPTPQPAKDTTTCVAVDAEGNMVAATPSGWSGVVAGDTGVWLGTRLQSFNTWKGHPNQIEPGKRPRITLTPTLILDGQEPVAAISVAGGDVQDQTILQLVVNYVDFGMEPAQAVRAWRFQTDHHVGSFRQTPAKLGSAKLNDLVSPAIADALRAKGHQVEIIKSAITAPVMITRDPKTGKLQAAGDPRAGRHAAAF